MSWVVVVRGAATDLGGPVLDDGDEGKGWAEGEAQTDATESAAAAGDSAGKYHWWDVLLSPFH